MEDSNPFRWVLAELKRVRMSICESIVFCRGGTLHDTVELFPKRCIGEACLQHSDKEGLERIGPFYRGGRAARVQYLVLMGAVVSLQLQIASLYISHTIIP